MTWQRTEPSAAPTCRLRPNATWTGWSLGAEDLFHYVLAVLHDPAYREANAGALRMEWPRIPLPGWPDGDIAPGAADELRSLLSPGPRAGPPCWTRRRRCRG